MVGLEEARAFVLDACHPLAVVTVPLRDALGMVLADAVVATDPVPPFANTAMDGYAVRAADTVAAPVSLRIVGTIAAGAAPDVTVGPGEAVRIMTGAPIPPGADAVVMVERTSPVEGDESRVMIGTAASVGDHVRPAAEDIAPGQEVFAAGVTLHPGHLGVLASVGATVVRAVARPVVGVLSTGDELVDGAGPLGPGQIRDSNRHTLLGLGRQSGFEMVDLGVVGDDESAIAAAVERGASSCDALVTSGGVSVGDFDFVKAVLDKLSGGTMRWMQVAIKPAKPLAFGTVGSCPVFGLPGNPVSSMVSFELFARPALRRMAGHGADDLDRPFVSAVADEPLRRHPDGKLHFARVSVSVDDDGRYRARLSGGQASNLLRAMALANALALLPDGEGVAEGDAVRVMLLT